MTETPEFSGCPELFTRQGSRELVSWVRWSTQENGAPSSTVINLVWSIHCLTSECLI